MNMNNVKMFATLVLLFTACTLYGQTSGTVLSGVIVDANTEDPLPGAAVVIEGLGNGVSAGKNGDFTFKSLPLGKHKITVSFMGYKHKWQEVTLRRDLKSHLVIKLEPEIKSLNEVVITAKSEARKLREQAMPLSVISMSQLQGTVSNIQDVLSKTVGVTIRSTGGVGSAARISVRGLEGKRIGFYIDDTPITEHSDFIDINDIPVEMIDRIEIYKGVVPAKFGGSSVGGAVNIVIKEYPPKYLDASYTIESFNTHKASLVTKANNAAKGIEMGIGSFYTYSDNSYRMKSPFQDGLTIKRDHDQFKKLAFGGSLKARKWWFDEVEFEPVYLRTFKQLQGIQYNIQKAHTFSDAYILANNLKKKDFLISGLDLDFNVAYAYTRYSMVDTSMHRYNWDGSTYPAVSAFGGEIGTSPSNSNNQKHTILNKINFGYLISNHHSINFNSYFTFAKGIPKDSLKDKVIGYQTNYNTNMKSWVAGVTYDFRAIQDKLLNSLTFKYYYYSIKTRMADYSGMGKLTPIDMQKSNYGISNAIRYRLWPSFMLKGAASYEVRLPSESELIGDGYIVAPTGNLLPERNTNINIGFLYDLTGHSSSNLQIEVNAFYMHLQDMIRFMASPVISRYENFGEMRTLGAELEVKGDITPWLYGYANTTFQDLRDTRRFEPNSNIPNLTKGCRIPNVPYFMANAGIELHRENFFGGKYQNTRLFFEASFVEEYFYDFEQSNYQERKIPRTASLNVGLEHSLLNQSVFLSGKINNLTDTRMLSEYNRPLPGRNFGLRLRYILK